MGGAEASDEYTQLEADYLKRQNWIDALHMAAVHNAGRLMSEEDMRMSAKYFLRLIEGGSDSE